MSATPRVLIAEFDSPAQADRFRRRGASRAVADLTGMLRLGTLISDTVLVTDVMLFDGAYFVELGPEGVLRELGASRARFPLTVTGPHDSFREGIAARRNDDAFTWSLPQIEDPHGIPHSVERSWEQWAELVDSGVIRYEKQTARSAPLRLGAPEFGSPKQREQLKESGLDSVRARSAAFRMIAELDGDDDFRRSATRWWNDAYLRMIAENASADWLCFETHRAHAPELRENDVELRLATSLTIWAHRSAPATIAVAWDATEHRRRLLHRKPNRRRMRDLAFAATQVTSAPSRPGVLWGSVLKLGAAVLVIVLALPILEDASIDSPWAWAAFAGAIATTIPFDSLKALYGLLRRDPFVRLVLHRRTA